MASSYRFNSSLKIALGSRKKYFCFIQTIQTIQTMDEHPPDSVPFRRKVIDSLVNAVWLWDDRLRIAFNFSGKGSTVERELVMDAEAIAGVDGSYNASCAPPHCCGLHIVRSDFFTQKEGQVFLGNLSFSI